MGPTETENNIRQFGKETIVRPFVNPVLANLWFAQEHSKRRCHFFVATLSINLSPSATVAENYCASARHCYEGWERRRDWYRENGIIWWHQSIKLAQGIRVLVQWWMVRIRPVLPAKEKLSEIIWPNLRNYIGNWAKLIRAASFAMTKLSTYVKIFVESTQEFIFQLEFTWTAYWGKTF